MSSIDLSRYLRRGTCHSQEEEYLERLSGIFSAYPHFGVPSEPSQVVPGVFLGSSVDADNVSWMQRNIITHVVNCSAPYREYRAERRPKPLQDAGVSGYLGLDAKDKEDYDMTPHFRHVIDYMKRCRLQGARILVVSAGTSAAATIVMAYLLIIKNMYLLEAGKLIKDLRRTAICHIGFMRQLVALAEERGLLDPNPGKIRAPSYGTAADRHRLLSVGMPSVTIVDWWRPVNSGEDFTANY